MKDHNTKFFIESTLIRRKRNEIIRTKVNGRCIQGVSNLKAEIKNFFVQRFSQEPIPVFDFDLGNHPRISAEQAIALEAHPSREEVKNAVWACGVDKAPSFDRYNFRFIREMWEVIKEDVYAFVLAFFQSWVSMRSINITLGLKNTRMFS